MLVQRTSSLMVEGEAKRYRLEGIDSILGSEARVSEIHRITINAEQCGGRPCICGMRVREIDVLELLASGASREEILDDYPYLGPEDITAALEYAVLQV